ncbi:MAG TPA: ATP-binding cassette domain-containing protein, partial [Acetobacteraceae bacterium]
MPTDAPLLEVTDLSVRFQLDRGTTDAVRGVSFSLARGETLGLVGESGSGKSVTARSIMRLLPGTARLGPGSRISFQGTRLDTLPERRLQEMRGDRLGMVFQEPMTSLNPLYRIGTQIAESLRLHQGLGRRAALQRAGELLDEVRIPDPQARLQQYPHQLSGGQRQRVMIAMAIANNPDLLIADEPTTALDVTVQAEILDLIRSLQDRHGMAVLLITHDLTVVQRVCDRVCVMRHGQLVESGPAAAVMGAPSHPYTQTLVGSQPRGRPAPVAGDAPVLLSCSDVKVSFALQGSGLFRRQARVIRAVDGVSLSLRRGQTLGIVGESGSGKSTLGRALLRLGSINSGRVSFAGERIDGLDRRQMRRLRPRMQVVFQDPFASLNPRLSVRQIIEEGLIVNRIGGAEAERDRRMRRVLDEVGLPGAVLYRFPHEFSGGQR